MGRRWYEVRVRERVGPRRWVKKSKFFFERGPKEARQKYTGDGTVMWTEKADQEKLLGIGSFFRLGDRFLSDLRAEQTESLEQQAKRKEVEKHRQRRGSDEYWKHRQEATD